MYSARYIRQFEAQITDGQEQLAVYEETFPRGKGYPTARGIVGSAVTEPAKSGEVLALASELVTGVPEGEERPPLHGAFLTPPQAVDASEYIRRYADKLGLNREQRDIFDVYCAYLVDPLGGRNGLPTLTLLHGAAGTGKSFVVGAIMHVAAKLGRKIIVTGPRWSASAVGATVAARSMVPVPYLEFFGWPYLGRTSQPPIRALQALCGILPGAAMVLVDGLSNQPPVCLGLLSAACQRGLESPDRPFGGLPVLLVGDLCQLMGPPHAHSLCWALLAVSQREEEEENPLEPPVKKFQNCRIG